MGRLVIWANKANDSDDWHDHDMYYFAVIGNLWGLGHVSTRKEAVERYLATIAVKDW